MMLMEQKCLTRLEHDLDHALDTIGRAHDIVVDAFVEARVFRAKVADGQQRSDRIRAQQILVNIVLFIGRDCA